MNAPPRDAAAYPVSGIASPEGGRQNATRANSPVAPLSAAMTDLSPVSALALPAPVLVVEDEPLVCRRLERLLGQLGYPAGAGRISSMMRRATNGSIGAPPRSTLRSDSSTSRSSRSLST